MASLKNRVLFMASGEKTDRKVPSLHAGVPRAVWWCGVVAVSLLGSLLRVLAIDHDSLWFDEAVTARLIQVPISDLVTGRVFDLGNPPFYLVVGHIWSIFAGHSEAGLRSLPVACSVLTIPLVALVGRHLIGLSVGLWGAFLLAISPTAIELSNEARAYSLMGLLAVASTWFFLRWLRSDKLPDLALYALGVFLVCYTHYYGGVVPIAHAASLAVIPRDRGRVLWWIGAMMIVAVLGSTWLPTFVAQVRTSGNLSRMGDRWITQFLATPMVFGLGRNLAWRESSAWMLGSATLGALVGFWVPALYGLYESRRKPFAGVLLGFWCLAPIIGPLLVALTLSPIYATRYAFVGLPAFVLLTGWGLQQFPTLIRRMLFVLILICTSLSLLLYVTHPLKDNWRAATEYVLNRKVAEEVVAVEPDHEIETFLYYAPRFGGPPPEMIAISAGPGHNRTLRGTRYLTGVRFDARPCDCTASLLCSSGIWLVRCASEEPLVDYVEFFALNGFRLQSKQRSHRIEVLHFVEE